MVGTKGTGDSVGLFDDIKQHILAKEAGAVWDTAVLSTNTLDTSGSSDAALKEGYALVYVRTSGTGAQAADVGKWREFDSTKSDLDAVSDVAILASPVDLGEHSGDIKVPILLHGFVDGKFEHHNGTLDYDNNARLDVLPM